MQLSDLIGQHAQQQWPYWGSHNHLGLCYALPRKFNLVTISSITRQLPML